MTNFESLRRDHPRDASDAVTALSMIAGCDYEDGNIDTGRFYGQLSDAVLFALVSEDDK
jgi:hypothetical protein